MKEEGSLPPLLAEGLDRVFVGTQPGDLSVATGCYYADPTNAFYQHLDKAQFTPRRLQPREFRELLAYRVGLDDVYDDPDALRSRIEAVRPRAVCFNSGDALRRFAGVEKLKRPWRREAASSYAEIAEVLMWATSDSSWRASKHWSDRITDLQALHHRLSEHP